MFILLSFLPATTCPAQKQPLPAGVTQLAAGEEGVGTLEEGQMDDGQRARAVAQGRDKKGDVDPKEPELHFCHFLTAQLEWE